MDKKKNLSKALSQRDRELVAIGAAIASNCVPCIEYHIPQARKVGLSDSQIHATVELADKVRRIPADKVLQTAFALLAVKNASEKISESQTCGCSDTHSNSREEINCGKEPPDELQNQLDNQSINDNNKSTTCNDRAGDKMGTSNTERSEKTSGSSAGEFRFNRPKMMGKCCPEEMKNFALKPDFNSDCCSGNESD